MYELVIHNDRNGNSTSSTVDADGADLLITKFCKLEAEPILADLDNGESFTLRDAELPNLSYTLTAKQSSEEGGGDVSPD